MGSDCNAVTVAWFDPDQFRMVRKLLFSESLSDKRKGIEQITVWESRVHPNLPTAIEATAFLIRAVIQDCLYEAEKTFCLEKDVQSMYSMAIVRCVNLILEVGNEGRKHSLLNLAKDFNLPTLLVEIRHEVTHSHVPSLHILRIAANVALKYLEDIYWCPEEKNIRPFSPAKDPCEEAIASAIRDFRSIQLNFIQEDNSRNRSYPKETKIAVKKLEKLLQKNCKLFVKILAQASVFVNPSDLEVLFITSGVIYFDRVECAIALPDAVEQFWRPVITLLHEKAVIPLFLETLLLSLEDCCIPLCQNVAVAWVTEILNAENSEYSYLAKLFRSKGLHINYNRLIFACLSSATKYSIDLFNLLVFRSGEDISKYESLCEMMHMKLGNLADCKMEKEPFEKRSDSVASELYFTYDDALDDAREERKKRNIPEGLFSEPSGFIDFSQLPLGAVINPVIKKNIFRQNDALENLEGPENTSIDKNDDESGNESATQNAMDVETPAEIVIKSGMLYKRR